MKIITARNVFSSIILWSTVLNCYSVEKRLVRFETTEDHIVYDISYDQLTGKVSRIDINSTGSYHWDIISYIFDWSEYVSGIVTVTPIYRNYENEIENMFFELNKDGYLIKYSYNEDGENYSYEYILNENNECIQIIDGKGHVYDSFRWENGDLRYNEEEKTSLFYNGGSFITAQKDKSNVISVFLNSYCGELSTPEPAIFAGLMKGSTNLVDFYCNEYEDFTREDLIYEFDEDYYPIKITEWVQGSQEPYSVFTCTWEDNPFGGVDEILSHYNKEENTVYYSIDGVAHNIPVRGLNIVRGAGSCYKFIKQ